MNALAPRPAPLDVPGRFTRLALTEHTFAAPSGRTVRFVDTGPAGGIPLLVLTGGATSGRAVELLEFARPLRERFGIRLLAVERNGLGATAFDPSGTPATFADDVGHLLDHLDLDPLSIAAISGGGLYAAEVAAARPDRVRSLHLACAVSDLGLTLPPDAAAAAAADPVAWWRYPEDSPVRRIPGFVEATVDEATRAFFTRGAATPPDALHHEFTLLNGWPCPDLSALTDAGVPAFLLWGADDTLVPLAHAEQWQTHLGGRARLTVHPGEGHDVQYRHWDQVLTDVATLGESVMVADPATGATLLVPFAEAPSPGDPTLGWAAWLPGPAASEPENPTDDRVRTPYEGQAGRPWDPDAIEAPLRLHRAVVPTAWVDYNDHMSESCFLLAFGDNADAFFRYIGIDEAYRTAGHSLFSVETHLVHQGEADLGDEIEIALYVLGVDAKRVHILHVMTRAATGDLLATGEQMLLHVDLTHGRVEPLPEDLHQRLTALAAAHRGLPTPVQPGRAIRSLATPEPT